MRAIIFVVAVLLIMALVGWISFSSGPSRSSINIETQEIKQDTEKVMHSGAELLKDAGEAVEGKDDRVDPESTVIPTTTPIPSAAPLSQ
jgi:hypothetical protein